ncbi:MAG: DNA methyltransferase [Bacteroidota bacterium]
MMAEFVNSADKKSFVRILDEDTRQKTSVPIGSVDLVVTSPPYGDSKTTVAYGQYSRLSLQWLDLPWERVKNIDSHSLGGRKNATILDNLSSTTLEQTLKEIQAIDKIRVKDVDSFFVDFQSCLKEIHRVCKKGATLCFVVGNRTVKGVKIPMDTIVAEMASELGFKYVETKHRNIPNKRMPSKNSPSNIEGELGETMTKEHIVILKKIP